MSADATASFQNRVKPRVQNKRLWRLIEYLNSPTLLACFLHALPSPALSGVLKDYLRELPFPLISKNLYEAVLESMTTRPLRIGAAGCENDQADSEHTVSLLDSLPEVEKVRKTSAPPPCLIFKTAKGKPVV